MDFFYTYSKGVNRPVLTFVGKTNALRPSEAEILHCPSLRGWAPNVGHFKFDDRKLKFCMLISLTYL